MSKTNLPTESKNNPFAMSVPSFIDTASQRGQENVELDDITIPRLILLQQLSPQCLPRDSAYVQGAEEGKLFNSLTNEIYGDEVFFVPVYFEKAFVIFKKQSAGGGFAGSFSTRVEAMTAFNQANFSETTYEIVETGQQFGCIVNAELETEQILCSMSASKMKISKKLNSLCKMNGGDRFSRVYKLEAKEETNSKSQTYWNLEVSQIGFPSESVYLEAEKMYEAVSSEAGVKVDHGVKAEKEVKASSPEDRPYEGGEEY